MECRIKYIDVAKGISISLVAVAHSKLEHHLRSIFDYNSVMEPMALFRMPLFFFLSGIFFSCQIAPRYFFLKKAESILKPYFAVSFLVLFLNSLMGRGNLDVQLIGIFYGDMGSVSLVPLWFLTHLFALYAVCYVLFRCLRFKNHSFSLQAVILFLLIAVGALINLDLLQKETLSYGSAVAVPALPFTMDMVLFTSIYFVAGNLLKNKLVSFKPQINVLICCVYLFFCIVKYTGAQINIGGRVYNEPLFATLAAFAGIYVVISCAWWFSRIQIFSVVFQKLGEASIYILIFHYVLYAWMYSYLTNGLTNETVLALATIVSLVFGITAPLLVKLLVERSDVLALAFLPFRTNALVQKIWNVDGKKHVVNSALK